MSKKNQHLDAKSRSIPLPAESFTPTNTRLRAGSSVTPEIPPNCEEFYDKDEAYRKWCRDNPDGWVMNNYRVHDGPVPAHKQDMENTLKIHHVTGKAHVLKRSSTTRYRKLCCADRKPLEDFKRTIIARTTGM